MTVAWWPVVGVPSLVGALILGFFWACFSTIRRRRRFARAGLLAAGQSLWFLASFISMSSYLALVGAVSLMALYDMMARDALWFLLATAAGAFCTALMFSNFEIPEQLAPTRPARPAAKPVAKSADQQIA